MHANREQPMNAANDNGALALNKSGVGIEEAKPARERIDG